MNGLESHTSHDTNMLQQTTKTLPRNPSQSIINTFLMRYFIMTTVYDPEFPVPVGTSHGR